ncbi:MULTISPECIES: LuxE/PaaK family acyltransferase [Flavobacterium]|uniref:Acyl transferase n=1 Tax=Flavobacterium columnare TaxID=996 RepID=A0AA94JPG0_9FLAO|nr:MULTISPECIES: acyl transferase [Flavobacterium]OXA83108.1 acyl transferase [Flavobacterium columnare] [Flavobacterium columnare NBRC 100251 = ATCC 23463]AMA48894.1 acyl transferase [Flavobacterium covae]AND64974.1 acyl transferase [Flavobacterium covae]MCH4830859.1 acyl transferase [Flavobacterium columnare]MCH4833201.1 acyl transferase [Flavobacterium columnare]
MYTSNDIFEISSKKEFEKRTLKIFRFQYHNNLVYQQFCSLLKKDVSNVKKIEDIPFLPIQFFKTNDILSSKEEKQITFTSSGTTGIATSKHHVTDLSFYRESYRQAFKQFYGNIEDYVILALLPSYLEREGSSLIYMVDDLIQLSNNLESGFYLNNYDELIEKLIKLDAEGHNVLLIGVTYALLDLVEKQKFNLKNTIIMETGGMKGRRKEIIREELHKILSNGFGVPVIHSEYGMTELLSQAYSLGNGIFECPMWMKIIIRDPEDPLTLLSEGKTGGINIIDLANINSCSFIATQDLGKIIDYNSFEVLGRFDNSDIRGCNLMVV